MTTCTTSRDPRTTQKAASNPKNKTQEVVHSKPKVTKNHQFVFPIDQQPKLKSYIPANAKF